MIKDNAPLMGGAGLIVGAVMGALFGGGGPDIDDIKDVVAEQVSQAGEQTSALGEKIGAIEAQLGDTVSRLGGFEEKLDASSEALNNLQSQVSEQIAGLGRDISTAMQGLSEQASGQADAIKSGFADLTASTSTAVENAIGSLKLAPSDAGAPADAEGATADTQESSAASEDTGAASSNDSAAGQNAPAESSATDQSADASDASSLKVGEIVKFDDAGIRVFLSGVDSENGTARFAVNGVKTLKLTEGASRRFAVNDSECRVYLRGVSEAAADFDTLCNGDLPEPKGTQVGYTHALSDTIRAFVSKIDEDESSVRLAINGFKTVTVPNGDSTTVNVNGRECAVSVLEIDRGFVSLDSNCD